MSQEIHKYYETAHYPTVLNRVIYDIYSIRKELHNRPKHQYNHWLGKYREAVKAFLIILIPSWKPDVKIKDVDGYTIDELDSLVEEIIAILDKKKVLIRGKRIPVYEEVDEDI